MKSLRKNIKINKPCLENWDSMQDSLQGKFCEKCAKNIIDFTEKSDCEIQDIFNKANGKEICGRISSMPFSKIATGFILVSNLTFGQAQSPVNISTATVRQNSVSAVIIKISGHLIFKDNGKIIPNAEIFFISKEKYIKTLTDETGYFELEIPREFIRNKNVLFFSFDKVNDEIRKKPDRIPSNKMEGDTYENNFTVFSKDETISNKEFSIESKKFYVGGAVIVSPDPPDYYYFNGKSISEEEFKKLRRENPEYQYFIFDGKIAEIISKKISLDNLYLLFSDNL